MSKIKKGDKVVVINGKDRKKTGIVLKREQAYVTIEGINLRKKCVKRDPQNNVEGGFKDINAPIHISNVAYYDENAKKPVKIGIKVLSNGEKKRYNKSTNQEVD
ncbi:MAG: 50S ribosomal protein L24 [Pseudomonadota bacterium]|nr:50S ribosomal protein L24 [Pseudomonadota bacterium]